MKNFVQEGSILRLTAPGGGVTGGKPYVIGKIFCVAQADAAEAAPFEGVVEGVVELDKDGSSFVEGDAAYFHAADKTISSTSSGNVYVGAVVETAGGSDTTCRVRLNESSLDESSAEQAAAATSTHGGAGNAGKLLKLDADGKLDGRQVNDDGAKIDKVKAGTVTIASAASSGTTAMGASTWDGKPVAVTLQSTTGDGKISALGVPFVKAAIAAGTLTVTLIDKDGAPFTNPGTGNMIFSFVTFAG